MKFNLLAPMAADDYLSTFKHMFTNMFRDKTQALPFQPHNWSKHRQKLKAWKKVEQVKDEKPVFKPTEYASNEDRWTVFVMCDWCNLLKGAMFLLIMNIMMQIGGRVGEGSTIMKEGIKVV
eukprot:13910956-Ditylum_brightwellii.AAC.1